VQETANENNASNHKRRIFHYLCIDNIFITDIDVRHKYQQGYNTFQLYDDLRAELTRDPTLCSLCDEVCTGVRGDEWKLTDGIITMVGRIYIPLSSSCLPAVLAAAHGRHTRRGGANSAPSATRLLPAWRDRP
jgi:hypothetical protein